MAGDIGPQDAAAEPAAALIDKVETLARLCATLRASSQRVSVDGGLTQARLGAALLEAMATRAVLADEAKALALTGYRAAARPHARPRRRNRVARRIDETLNRLRSLGRAGVIARSGLWTGGGSRAHRLRAMAAYARRGSEPAVQPSALFDQAWYLGQRPDLAGSGTSPLVHYLLAGAAEGVDPHPLFATRFYAERNAAQLGATGLTPLEHFVRIGAGEGRDPHPLFDTAYYLRQAPDLIESGENPLAHYLREGVARSLSPHPLFAPDYYADQFASAGEVGEASLTHYLTRGSALGLKPHPLFDPAWSREQYPQGAEPLTHYVLTGAVEALSPSAWFDAPRYVALRGPDLAHDRNPLLDYLDGGAWTVSEPWPGRPAIAYLSAAAELAASGMTPLEHWARQGSPP